MTETILIIFAIHYYVFCVSLLIVLNTDNILGTSTIKNIGTIITILLFAPFVTPCIVAIIIAAYYLKELR